MKMSTTKTKNTVTEIKCKKKKVLENAVGRKSRDLSGRACTSKESPVRVAPLIMHGPLRPAADGHNRLSLLAATSRRSRWRAAPGPCGHAGRSEAPENSQAS